MCDFFLPPDVTRSPSQKLLRPQNVLDDLLSSDLKASFVLTMSLNSPPPLPPANARITSGTTLLLSEHQCSTMAMDISPSPSRTIFDFKGENQIRPRPQTFGRELGNFGTPSANDSLTSLTKTGAVNVINALHCIRSHSQFLSSISSMQPHRFSESASAPISICRCFRCHGGQ